MANNTVALNQKDVSIRIRVLDDTDGTPMTTLAAATAGHEIWYQRGPATAPVTDGGSAADLASITAAHSDWGFDHISDGWYRVDFPDAAFLEGEGTVLCGMSATGYTGISEVVVIEPLFKYQGTADSVTSTTTTFPSGTTPLKGDIIQVQSGTGEPGNQVLVTSVSGEVATHAAFETGISASATTILLIAGEAITAAGGIEVGDAATPTEVNAEVDQAITDAALATADKMLGYFQLALRSDTPLTTDRATELAEINANEGTGAGSYDQTTDGLERGNTKRLNDTLIIGTGVDGDLWRAD